MRTHPGRTVSIYEVAELVKQAFMSAMTPTNITSGFRATGIYPYNRDIFPDEDYAPSMVTDGPNPEEPSTSAAADPSGPSHEEPTHATGLEAGPYPGEPPATLPEPNPQHSLSDETGSGAHGSYVSPKVILPLPKATARRPRMTRKKVKTRIVTDTPEKMELEKAHKEKQDEKAEKEIKKNERQKKWAPKGSNQTKIIKKKVVHNSSEESTMGLPLDDTTDDKAEDDLENTHNRENKRAEKQKMNENKKRGALKVSKSTKRKKKVTVYSSSEESDISIPLNDTTDYESSDVQNDDDDDGDKDLSAGDFVIVSFAGKTKSYNYVGLVEKVEGADISAKFLRQSCKKSVDGKPIFTFKENDEGVIPRGDVLKKLPTPQNLGGTARREQKFIFPGSIDKWDVT